MNISTTCCIPSEAVCPPSGNATSVLHHREAPRSRSDAIRQYGRQNLLQGYGAMTETHIAAKPNTAVLCCRLIDLSLASMKRRRIAQARVGRNSGRRQQTFRMYCHHKLECAVLRLYKKGRGAGCPSPIALLRRISSRIISQSRAVRLRRQARLSRVQCSCPKSAHCAGCWPKCHSR